MIIRKKQKTFTTPQLKLLTSIGGDDRKLVRVARLVVQFGRNANLAGARSHLELGDLLVAFAEGVIYHRIDATVRIGSGYL